MEMMIEIEKMNEQLEFEEVFKEERALLLCDAFTAKEVNDGNPLPCIVLQMSDGRRGRKDVNVTLRASPEEMREFLKNIESCVKTCTGENDEP
jgi:hypothetical protein